MSRESFIAGVAGLVLMVGGPMSAQAQEEVEVRGNVSLTSDYTFRGISQTLEEPAVQGGLDVSGPLGLYAGVWGSSINFGEDLGIGPRAQLEMDAYVGIAPSAGPLALDFGALYYGYPGAAEARDYDFVELYGSAGTDIGPVSAGLTGAYSPDFFARSGTGWFGGAEASLAVPGTSIGLDAALGRQWIEINDNFGTPDYTFWSVGATTEVVGLGVGAAVVGPSLDNGQCFGGSDLCRTRLIVSVGRGL
ncbi:MAG TPA: TorF family putative porin [Longimicrobiaceae bacterium]|nr:TorF family putative porin [Longimicrobiaceae bacterium]